MDLPEYPGSPQGKSKEEDIEAYYKWMIDNMPEEINEKLRVKN